MAHNRRVKYAYSNGLPLCGKGTLLIKRLMSPYLVILVTKHLPQLLTGVVQLVKKMVYVVSKSKQPRCYQNDGDAA
jgi:hypothetical protein